MNKTKAELDKHKKVIKEYAEKSNTSSFESGDGRWYNKHHVSKFVFNEERAKALAIAKKLDPAALSNLKLAPEKFEALLTVGVITQEQYLSLFDDVGTDKWMFDKQSISEKETNEYVGEAKEAI